MNALFRQRKRQNRIEKVENREEAIRGGKNCNFLRTVPKNDSYNMFLRGDPRNSI